jgi:hypothetical protein
VKRETTLYRQEHCLWCGAELEHRAAGRGKQFCGARCRVYYQRAVKRHAGQCVDAALAGEPEPARDFGHPIKITSYTVNADGTVTKRRRPGLLRNARDPEEVTT